MTKTKVLLIFGGSSSEHEVSIMSARNVESNVDRDKFEVKLAYINKSGQWFRTSAVTPDEKLPLKIDLEKQAFLEGDEAYRPEVILPILHGSNGEDGMIAAIGQLMSIRVVGCDMTASAVSMDKLLAKKVVEFDGVPIVPFRSLHQSDQRLTYEELTQDLGETIFIKPTREGSSVGVSKVKNQAELTRALDEAFKHDDIVLIEKAMVGRELEVAVFGKGSDLIVSSPGEILVGQNDEFYSYDSKYASDSKTTTTVSAEISPKLKQKIQVLARTVYQSLRCAGLARVDFFLVGDELFFNEINTMPGFTNISMYPKMMENAGVSQKELITKLIEIA